MRAAIYARYSSENQQEASIDDQIRSCGKLIEDRGWTLVQTYSDRAISGSTTLRHGYQQLLSDAYKNQFDVVVSEGLDRLSRDQETIAALYKQLCFVKVHIVTRAEGDVSEIHIGLKGTMNALFLKDLAIKTHRGLEGRVRAGRSAGGRAYGYDVVRALSQDGEPIRGQRMINEVEAAIVRRIFLSFQQGHSPQAIARMLNADRIPGPNGKSWRATAIRGHATRRTGILRNNLYVGQLVWNKQTYVRDPSSGKRLARVNPEREWISTEVPELRILDNDLWNSVQQRLRDVRESSVSKTIRKREFWKDRRPRHLLTGLVHCGACGNKLASAGKDYLSCQAARSNSGCNNHKGVQRSRIERAVLEGLKTQLMEPELVEAFMIAFHDEVNRQRMANAVEYRNVEQQLRKIEARLEGLYDAIADGLRTPGLKDRLVATESERDRLRNALSSSPPPEPYLHPNLSRLYREKVKALHAALDEPETKTEAAEILRGLIEQINVTNDDEGIVVELIGDIVKLVALPGDAIPLAFASSVKVVAGTRSRRYLNLSEAWF